MIERAKRLVVLAGRRRMFAYGWHNAVARPEQERPLADALVVISRVRSSFAGPDSGFIF
jgi:hypothetical protein